tara:strand:- start:567 stop:800 length:234 start_codon:yes stop_codon:yes gene_type:complete
VLFFSSLLETGVSKSGDVLERVCPATFAKTFAESLAAKHEFFNFNGRLTTRIALAVFLSHLCRGPFGDKKRRTSDIT